MKTGRFPLRCAEFFAFLALMTIMVACASIPDRLVTPTPTATPMIRTELAVLPDESITPNVLPTSTVAKPPATPAPTVRAEPTTPVLPVDISRNILAWTPIADLPGKSITVVKLAVDSRENLHVIWWTDLTLLHRMLGADGNWSQVETLIPRQGAAFTPVNFQVSTTTDKQVCVIWLPGTPSKFYEKCFVDGKWTERQIAVPVPKDAYLNSFATAFDPQGRLAVVERVQSIAVLESRLVLNDQMLVEGVPGKDLGDYRFMIDRQGGYHLFFFASEMFWHRYSRDQGKTWAPAESLAKASGQGGIWDAECGPQGTVHLIWTGLTPDRFPALYYRVWTSAGGWGPDERINGFQNAFRNIITAVPPAQYPTVYPKLYDQFSQLDGLDNLMAPDLTVDNKGRPHITGMARGLLHITKSDNGRWQFQTISQPGENENMGRSIVLGRNDGKMEFVAQSLKALYYARLP